MRPGRAEDLPAVLELWREDVRAGSRDCVPSDGQLNRLLAGFTWDVQSRMVERSIGGLDGAVLVVKGPTSLGTVAVVDASVAHNLRQTLTDLTRWGLSLSQAAGAAAAQVWRGHGHTEGLDQMGLALVRPWWRMDHSLTSEPIEPQPVAGYELRDATNVPEGIWADAHNLSFADHWRFWPRTEEVLMTGRDASLSLMALSRDGSAAALTLSHVEHYRADRRPQPVGVLSSVGTLPEHRRRGLATWLVAETLVRLHRAGARHASLYVDGRSPMKAFEVYRKVGFELAFETEVWEARFQ